MKNLITEIDIKAPSDRVWNILIEFESYPEWNQFIRSIDEYPEEGKHFKVTIQPPGSKTMNFRPTCLKMQKTRSIAGWDTFS